jgi:hypothetical protein
VETGCEGGQGSPRAVAPKRRRKKKKEEEEEEEEDIINATRGSNFPILEETGML